MGERESEDEAAQAKGGEQGKIRNASGRTDEAVHNCGHVKIPGMK